MKVIETIKIRTGAANARKHLEALQQISIEALQSQPDGPVLFCQNSSIPGDFAYFLFGDDESMDPEGSARGTKIRNALEPLGIVDYAIWALIA